MNTVCEIEILFSVGLQCMAMPRVNLAGPKSEISQQEWSSPLNLDISSGEEEVAMMSST